MYNLPADSFKLTVNDRYIQEMLIRSHYISSSHTRLIRLRGSHEAAHMKCTKFSV